VAEGTLRVMRNAPAGEIYHFSTTRNISVRQVVELITGKLGVKFEEAVEIVGERPGKDAAYLLDSAKAKATLGWTDKISLEEGVDETIAWAKNNLSEIKKQPANYEHKP